MVGMYTRYANAFRVYKITVCVGAEIDYISIVFLTFSSQILQRLAKWNSMLTEHESLERKKFIKITLTHGDATVINWSDADVVFINSTCFEDSLLEKLATQASDLKPGTFVFTVTKV